VKYPVLPSAMRPVPHSEELCVTKKQETLIFSDNTSDSDDDHGQQEGGNFDCVSKFEASYS
jgi:hypothetical protein